MTIRIDRIERRVFEGHYSWHLNFKGVHGKGEYGELATGVDGLGLSFRTTGTVWTELLASNRFEAHPDLSAEQVTHRVAACLVCLGWGPEFYDDRDSITRGRSVTASVTTTRLLGPVDI